MDKLAPKADQFRANLDRAAPLLAKLKADGISHTIPPCRISRSNIAPPLSFKRNSS